LNYILNSWTVEWNIKENISSEGLTLQSGHTVAEQIFGSQNHFVKKDWSEVCMSFNDYWLRWVVRGQVCKFWQLEQTLIRSTATSATTTTTRGGGGRAWTKDRSRSWSITMCQTGVGKKSRNDWRAKNEEQVISGNVGKQHFRVIGQTNKLFYLFC
jgi:hypothetical protein